MKSTCFFGLEKGLQNLLRAQFYLSYFVEISTSSWLGTFFFQMGWTVKEDSLVGRNTWNQRPRCLRTSGTSYSKRQSNWWSVSAPPGTLQENCRASSAGSKGGVTSCSVWHHFRCVYRKCLYEDQESTAPRQLPRKGSINVSHNLHVPCEIRLWWRNSTEIHITSLIGVLLVAMVGTKPIREPVTMIVPWYNGRLP